MVSERPHQLAVIACAALLFLGRSICLRALASVETNVTATASGLPNGVAAGDVTTDSAVLWTHASNLGSVTFVLSTNEDFTGTVWQGVTNVTDATVPVKASVSALTAGTRYFYRATDAAGNSGQGQFRTPASAGRFTGLHFGVSGDWRGDLAPYPSVVNAKVRDLDFFVELGDTIYADVPSPALTNSQAVTIAEFRRKHDEVYSSRLGLNALADLRASTAIFAVPDDHEVINNFAGGAPPSSDPRFDQTGAFVNETALYRNGLQAFAEFNPIRGEVYQTLDDPRTDGKPKLYRSQLYGRDAALFLLDARSFRDAELPSVDNPVDSAAVKAFNYATFDLDPNTGKAAGHRTMLGAAQLAALKADLLQAKAQGALWKVVLIGEPIQNLGFADGPDRFEGYASERTDLLKFIADNQIRNVVFVSADIHGTVINNVSYQVGPNQPLIPTGSFEVVTGPVAYDRPLGPTAFDAAASIQVLPGLTLLAGLLNYVGLPNRAAFDALPRQQRDDIFKKIMDVQLTAFGLDPTGLENSDINAGLLAGNYVAVHTYGWTEFQIDPTTHWLTVTTYGIEAYSPDQVDSSILTRVPQVVSQFEVVPQSELPSYPALTISRDMHSVQVTWPAVATNLVLQASPGPGQTTWIDVTNSPSLTGDKWTVTLAAPPPMQFFRLRYGELRR